MFFSSVEKMFPVWESSNAAQLFLAQATEKPPVAEYTTSPIGRKLNSLKCLIPTMKDFSTNS